MCLFADATSGIASTTRAADIPSATSVHRLSIFERVLPPPCAKVVAPLSHPFLSPFRPHHFESRLDPLCLEGLNCPVEGFLVGLGELVSVAGERFVGVGHGHGIVKQSLVAGRMFLLVR